MIGYWMMDEPSGAVATDSSGNGNDGAYTSVTLGQTGIGDGKTCPSFDGAASRNNIYSANLDSLFNGAEGSIALWAKVFDANVWTDGLLRDVIRFSPNLATNFIIIRRTINNNELSWYYSSNSNTKQRVKAVSDTGWMHLGMTWSHSANEFKAYFNGVQEGATIGSLAVWSGALLAAQTNVGCGTASAQVWKGNVAHVVVYNTPLSGANMLDLATL